MDTHTTLLSPEPHPLAPSYPHHLTHSPPSAIHPQDFIKKGGYNVKPLMALWNLFLAVFSIIGATRLVPKLLSYVDRKKAWRTTL